MPTPKEKICDCLRCGYRWIKRVKGRPSQCPKCKQPNWDVKAGVLRRGAPPGHKSDAVPDTRCLRCGHKWKKRVVGRPVVCAKCRNAKWDTAPRTKKKDAPKRVR